MAYSITSVGLKHTQHLRQVLGNTQPHYAEVHNNRLMLAVDTFVQLGQWGRFSGWRTSAKEYLRGTGEAVTALRSYGDALAVFTRSNMFLITGNSERDWSVTQLSNEVGTELPESVREALGMLVFEASTGGYHAVTQDPDSGASCTNAHADFSIAPAGIAVYYAGPRQRRALHVVAVENSKTVLYRFDPTSLRRLPSGDVAFSWFRLPLTKQYKFVSETNGRLYGITATGGIEQLDVAGEADPEPMRITFAVPADAGMNSITKGMKITTANADGMIKRRARQMMIPTAVGERETMMDDSKLIRAQDGQAVRVYHAIINNAEDPHTPIITYESDSIGAALIEVAWFYSEGGI